MTAINTIPNVTDVERDTDLTSVPKGSLIFNTDSDELQVNVSSGWISVVDSLNSSPEQNVYVSNDGNDLTGNGTIAFPYQTIEFALTQITDASQTKPYTIKVVTGQYFETNLLLKPYVNLDGGNSQVQVSGSIALDSSYTAGGNLRIYDFGILDVISGMALDFDTLNSAQSIIFMQNCRTFFNTGIEISGSTNFTFFISDDLIGFELTLNNTASILQNQSLGNVTITKDNTFPSYGVQLKSSTVNGLFTVNQNSTGIESLVIDTANCLVDSDSNFTCATGTASLNWNSQGDRLSSINLDGAGLLFITDGLSSIPNLTNGAIYNLRNLSNGLLANYTPSNYTPSDDSVNGHLVGIDNEIGIDATLQITYDAGNTIQLSSERNFTISDSLGDLVFDVVEDGANSNTVIYRKGIVTDNSISGPFFELNNSSIGQVGTELGTVSVSGLASDTSFRSFNAINHEVIDASPGNYSVSQFFNSYENGIETKYMEFDGIGQIEFYKTFDMKGNGIVAAGNINANGLSALNTVSAQDLTATDTVSGQNVLTDTLNISTSTANTLLSTDGFKNVVSGNLSGDVTTNNSLLTTLSTVNSNVGTFGDANNVSQVTVDSKGRITAVSNVSISSLADTLQTAYDNGVDGNITLSAGKPFEITGIDNIDTGSMSFYTPVANGVNSIFFSANNDSAARTITGAIAVTLLDGTAGLENGIVQLAPTDEGALVPYISLDATEKFVYLLKETNATDRLSVNGVVSPKLSTYLPTQTASTEIGQFTFDANNTTGLNARQVYSDLTCVLQDPTDLIESGLLTVNSMSVGTSITYIEIDGAANTIKVPNSTSGLLDEVATLGDVGNTTLQQAYDNSSPGYNINLNPSLFLTGPNPANNFQFAAGVGAEMVFRADGSTGGFSFLKLESNNSGGGIIGRICFDDLSTAFPYGDINVTATSATPGSESSDITFTGISLGTVSDFISYVGATNTVELIDTNITTTTASTSVTTGSLINNGGFGNAGDINSGGNISSLSLTTASINNLTPVGGLSSGISNSAILTASTAEQSIASATFVGNRQSPANSFQVGDAFVAVLAGNFASANGDTLTLRLKGGIGSATILSEITVPLNSSSATFFELEINFVIRAVGSAGVADIVANYDFSYNQSSGGNFQGERKCEVNNTTFDTTILNELDITAQFSSNSGNNSIETLLSTLGKTY